MDRLGGIVEGCGEDHRRRDGLGGGLVGCDVQMSYETDVTVAVLSGDLDTSSAFDVERQLDDALHAGPAAMRVSLQGLGFLDSSGLRVLLLLQRNAQRLGVPISFAGPQGAVRRTLDFAKALDYLGITE